MNPDRKLPDASFALLTTGANFSCEVLQALIQKGYSPGLVILPEYPPAPGGTDSVGNLISVTTPGRLPRLAQGIDIAYAPAARQAECFALIKRRDIDFLLVACWPYLIDTRLIETAAKAALNLHPSLLPKYRGPDPLEQQLAAGDPRFGITLHQLDQRFDHGDIIAQAELPDFKAPQTRATLELYCARLGVELFLDAVSCYPDWRLTTQSVATES